MVLIMLSCNLTLGIILTLSSLYTFIFLYSLPNQGVPSYSCLKPLRRFGRGTEEDAAETRCSSSRLRRHLRHLELV